MISSPPQIQARQILDIVYPIGIIVEFASNVNPNDIMHGQQWELYGQGKTTVCKDSGTFGTIGDILGAETHTLTVDQMPSHNHTESSFGGTNKFRVDANLNSGNATCVVRQAEGPQAFTENNTRTHGDSANRSGSNAADVFGLKLEHTHTINSTGGGQAHNNIQPSIVVLRYRRIA